MWWNRFDGTYKNLGWYTSDLPVFCPLKSTWKLESDMILVDVNEMQFFWLPIGRALLNIYNCSFESGVFYLIIEQKTCCNCLHHRFVYYHLLWRFRPFVADTLVGAHSDFDFWHTEFLLLLLTILSTFLGLSLICLKFNGENTYRKARWKTRIGEKRCETKNGVSHLVKY